MVVPNAYILSFFNFMFYFFSYNKRGAFGLMVVVGFFFLILMPETGGDYATYKNAYDNAYFAPKFPFFFTNSFLIAEPFYIWYNSFISVITRFDFQHFLAINFIICVLITKFLFRQYIKEKYLYYFWIMLLPVIFSTLFLFSPRSSISFIFILCGFIFFINNRIWQGTLSLFTGVTFHSQYMPIAILILITYFLFQLNKQQKEKYYYWTIGVLSGILFLGLYFIADLTDLLRIIFEILPSGEVATRKLIYFDEGWTHSKRITSILSLIIHPTIAIWLLRYVQKGSKLSYFKDESKSLFFMYMTTAIIIYGAIINIVFFDISHIAGRLSRFSDFVGFAIMIPLFFTTITKEKYAYLVIILFALIDPFLYPSVYSNGWFFL